MAYTLLKRKENFLLKFEVICGTDIVDYGLRFGPQT